MGLPNNIGGNCTTDSDGRLVAPTRRKETRSIVDIFADDMLFVCVLSNSVVA